jgi:hypothetical protein
MAGLIRVREGSSDDGAEFANVAHVNATHTRIERERLALPLSLKKVRDKPRGIL